MAIEQLDLASGQTKRPNDVPVLTIDGPSGSGKGTMAQRVARALGWHLLDSGALYRVLAFRALREAIRLDDPLALERCAEAMQLSFDSEGELPVPVCLDGDWVTTELRTEAVGKAASQVAAHPQVRNALLARQQEFRQMPGLVADGRDMGTVVFPDARFKVYLTASAQARAERRVKQLQNKGMPADVEQVLLQIKARDAQDINRVVAPLKPAADAVIIDSTDLSIDLVFERILEIVRAD
jgi:cytidylate kinase